MRAANSIMEVANDEFLLRGRPEPPSTSKNKVIAVAAAAAIVLSILGFSLLTRKTPYKPPLPDVAARDVREEEQAVAAPAPAREPGGEKVAASPLTRNRNHHREFPAARYAFQQAVLP